MTPFKAVIIDDEADARDTLETLIREYCPEIELVGISADLPSGIKLIYKERPDVVFLDIEMPEYSGLEILNFIEPELIRFEIIFTTAYSEYAIQAFKLSALDYLLKPIQIDQLQQAVAKIRQQGNSPMLGKRFEVLRDNLRTTRGPIRIALPVTDGILFISSEQIVMIKADRSYSEFILADGNKILVSKNLKEFEHLTHRGNFFRPHRSYIVNLMMVRQYIRKDGGHLLMENGEEIPVSGDRREELLQTLAQL